MAEIVVEGLSGYLAQAEQPGRGGVLLLPSHFGMNDLARDHAHELAQAGLTTVIWNQYTGRPSIVPTHEEAVQWGAELKDDVMQSQTSAWLAWMADELKVESLGVIGFCQGGRFALLVPAHDRRVAASVSFYPTITSPMKPNQDLDVVAQAGEVRCPVLLIHAGHDHVTTHETFTALRANLEARREATVVHLYPEADHGFFTRAAEPHNHSAVRLSWPQAVAFLKAALD
ncbi:MAG TPA: dienelactone hydrolase family protein [Chloroflexota bacterium]